MNLALILGQNSESIKPKLASVTDNLTIECFNDVDSYVSMCTRRDLSFDRVIILSTICNNTSTISKLHKHWGSGNRLTEIVFLCRKNTDDELAKRHELIKKYSYESGKSYIVLFNK